MVDEENLSHLTVIKRSGKKVEWNGAKIAIAIKKAFDALEKQEGEDLYTEKDVNKVFNSVVKQIEKEYKDQDKIKIEAIQDIIEDKLKKNYEDVYKTFSEYRERRNKSRQAFIGEKKQHKFVKAIENLGLKTAGEEDAKRENANVDGDTAMGTMLQYGSTVSKEFAKAYLMKPKFAEAHDNGDIHIHDLDFWPMGTTTCCQIDLKKLFKNGFSTGHGFLRPPKDIMSYTALAAIVIQSNQNDQHGGQAIPAFDYYMAPGVLLTFKKQFKQAIADFLDLTGFDHFINMDKIAKDIDKLDSIDVDLSIFDSYAKESSEVKKIFKKAYDTAYKKTDRTTYQAMEAFIHNLNTMHSRAGAQVPFSSINFGTDTSPEGRMVMKNYLLATDAGLGNHETPIFPISIFKLKEGVNYNKEDPNYDLFRLACEVSAKRLFPNFSFIDSPFNLEGYDPNNYETEVGYMGCRTRVLGNHVDPSKAITPGRGNLSFTSINLPRLGIKHGIVSGETDLDGFFKELGELEDLVKDELLERFEHQCSKHIYNFPFLLGQGVWIDSEKLKPGDRLRKVLKHGTLTVGFIGLAECLKALIGKHHGESKEAQELGLKIVKFMRDRVDKYSEEYNLNFSLIATPAEGLSGRFTNIDKAIYGKIKGVTDRDYYTNSFHVPVYYNISIVDKLKIEGPYHALTNGGHISYVELDGDTAMNVDAFEKIIRLMHDNKMGYGAINHPVDRDPVCGYTGVIGDYCPGCGRKEYEGVPIERVKNASLNSCGGR
ncbi:MAG TPA: anaerobic ribonucleoside triphosphate reductase [Candidatus Coprosoma intestinipullorum]|uniref:Anaerobic ribonucleoside triphosphate reductase n=1 Tax=Candidatus Coprosoma intestinipullorum TaxID=2840752 RepID=A0A9D0ZR90_9FIRM|nr:anaerobic ribonucleoside triphosphate reductase [Candidatus Coprosoma intestinipullorum]